MENDTRIIKAISYLDGALAYLSRIPLSQIDIKYSKTSIRNAMTLLRNTKTDSRIQNLEREVNFIKEILDKSKVIK